MITAPTQFAALAAARRHGTRGMRLKGLGMFSGREGGEPKRAAVLYVGRSFSHLAAFVGRVYPGHARPFGYMLGVWAKVTGEVSPRLLERETIRLREEQIGKAAGATFRRVVGFFEGKTENTTELVFIYTGEGGESFAQFGEHVLEIAEELAYGIAQKVVFVDLQDGGDVRSHAITPVGFPVTSAGDAYDRFLENAGRKEASQR